MNYSDADIHKTEVKWQNSLDKLFARVNRKCGYELIRKFIELSSLYISDNSNESIEPPLNKLLRSIDHRVRYSDKSFLEDFLKIIDLLNDNKNCFLPSSNEFNNYLLDPIRNFQNSYPFHQVSLSLSSPVAFPGKPSINILKRYFDSDQKLKLKLKLGIFYDDRDKLFWETGFIFPDKSIQQLSKNICEKDTRLMISGTILKKIVDNIFENLLQKKDICGIDLTPAHYHILPFSIRLGGQIINTDEYNEYKSRLSESIEYTFRKELNLSDEFFQQARLQYFIKNKLDTFTLSMLLYKGQIYKKNSRETFCWIPPRVVIAKT